MWVDAPEGSTREDLEANLRDELLPAVLPGTPAGLVIGWEPLPLQVDVPGIARSGDLSKRLLLLWFLDAAPEESFKTVADARKKIEEAGYGTVIGAIPFIPTLPGTDTYTDQLWTGSEAKA